MIDHHQKSQLNCYSKYLVLFQSRQQAQVIMAGEEEASFTLSQEELYRLALSFYKEQEGKGLQVVKGHLIV